MQEVPGSNPSTKVWSPNTPIPRLQVAKMRHGSQKGWCTRKPSTRDDKKIFLNEPVGSGITCRCVLIQLHFSSVRKICKCSILEFQAIERKKRGDFYSLPGTPPCSGSACRPIRPRSTRCSPCLPGTKKTLVFKNK